MAITGVQLIYRLSNTVRLLINHSDYSNVDSFNFYWDSAESGTFTNSFVEGILNVPSNKSAIRGKIMIDVIPDPNVSGWDNNITNWLKMAPVVGGVEGAKVGPIKIPTREQIIPHADKVIIYGYDEDNNRYIPAAVDSNGKMKTV